MKVASIRLYVMTALPLVTLESMRPVVLSVVHGNSVPPSNLLFTGPSLVTGRMGLVPMEGL